MNRDKIISVGLQVEIPGAGSGRLCEGKVRQKRERRARFLVGSGLFSLPLKARCVFNQSGRCREGEVERVRSAETKD